MLVSVIYTTVFENFIMKEVAKKSIIFEFFLRKYRLSYNSQRTATTISDSELSELSELVIAYTGFVLILYDLIGDIFDFRFDNIL
jgi:hypothetical protein